MSATTVAAARGRQEYRGVQALRAVAALAVVAGHSTDFLLRANGAIPTVFGHIHGPAGVDVFFVISGFVMAISSPRLRSRPHAPRLFLERRIIRIVPLYWLLTVLKYLVTTLSPGLSIHGRPLPRELLLSLLFIPYRTHTGDVHPLIPMGWTLSFEMLFYLSFAAALAVRDGFRRVLVPGMLLIAALSALRQPAWPLWTTLFDPIVLEFLAGYALAMLTVRDRLPARMGGVVSLILGAMILVLTVPPMTPFVARPAIWGVGAVAIVLGTVVIEPVLASRLPPGVLLLGDASYSIYLVQEFVFPVLLAVLVRLAPELSRQRPVLSGAVMLLSGLVCTAVAGVALYLYVERPMTRALREWMGAQRPTPVTS